MGNARKHKKIITILSIIIVAIYIFYYYTITGIYLQLDESERLTFINFFYPGIAQFFSLLIVPILTIILLNVKELELEKRYLLSRILVAISLAVILINLIIFYVLNWIWILFLNLSIAIWPYNLAFALMYLVEFVFSFAVFLLLRLKSELK